MYSITSNGIEKTETINIEIGNSYYMGASSSPDYVTIIDSNEKFITYAYYGEEKEMKIETWIGLDLISKGEKQHTIAEKQYQEFIKKYSKK